jgi:DivIVA domain-containing protein
MEISLIATPGRRAWHDIRVLYFQLVAVAAVFAAIAWLATGRGAGVGETHPDRPDVALPDDRQLRKGDVDAARFTVGWRGYRMDEVDMVLDRLAAEIDYRDRLIAELMPTGGVAVPELGYRPTSRAVSDVVPSFPGADASTEPVSAPDSQGDVATEQINRASQGDVPPDENPLSAWYRKPE